MPIMDSVSFKFQDLVTLTNLCSLQAESNLEQCTAPSKTFMTKYSDFYPLQSRTVSLELFQDKVEEELVAFKRHIVTCSNNKTYNLTGPERKAIQEPREMPDIVIRQADKGGAITILDKGLYLCQNLELLQDEKIYKKLSSNPMSQFQSILQGLIKEGTDLGIITCRQAEFLNVLNLNPVTPIFNTESA